MKKSFHSHGKLLITAEYSILSGAKALAVPCTLGQSLSFEETAESTLLWKSFDHQGKPWYQGEFTVNDFKEKSRSSAVGKQLTKILRAIRKLNPSFLNHGGGEVLTHLEFNRHWGLGSSSTLIANLAQWAKINPFQLLEHTFGGSGYDLSCAKAKGPIHYVRNQFSPLVSPVEFNPPFAKHLFFIYQNTKQNSRAEINRIEHFPFSSIEKINILTEAITNCKDQHLFNELLAEHESLIGQYVRRKPIQKSLFSDFKGQIKSLGAWGGDFMLVSGNENTIDFFRDRGYSIIYPFNALVLQPS